MAVPCRRAAVAVLRAIRGRTARLTPCAARDAELSSMLSATSSESLGGEEALLDCDAPRAGVRVAVAL
jgi:hypothetical protein